VPTSIRARILAGKNAVNEKLGDGQGRGSGGGKNEVGHSDRKVPPASEVIVL